MTETVTPPVPGSEAYNAAMIAVAEKGKVQMRVNTDPKNASKTAVITATPDAPADTTPAAKVRPDTVPEKFWDATKGEMKSADEILKAYVELEKMKSKAPIADPTKPAAAPAAPTKSTEQTAAEAEVTVAKAEAAAAADDVAKAAAKTKVDAAEAKLTAANVAAKAAAEAAAKPALNEIVSKASKEYDANGIITPESYAALEAQGLSKEYVDQYVDGMKARAEVVTRQVYDAAGGEDNYKSIQEWATANLSDQEVTAANEAFSSGKFDVVVGQVKSLKSRYDAAVGTSGKRIGGDTGDGSPGVGNPFRSKEEVMTAMKDKKYGTDPAYRKSVEARMAASLKANIDLGF